jgi:hypothetical protein
MKWFLLLVPFMLVGCINNQYIRVIEDEGEAGFLTTGSGNIHSCSVWLSNTSDELVVPEKFEFVYTGDKCAVEVGTQ